MVRGMSSDSFSLKSPVSSVVVFWTRWKLRWATPPACMCVKNVCLLWTHRNRLLCHTINPHRRQTAQGLALRTFCIMRSNCSEQSEFSRSLCLPRCDFMFRGHTITVVKHDRKSEYWTQKTPSASFFAYRWDWSMDAHMEQPSDHFPFHCWDSPQQFLSFNRR